MNWNEQKEKIEQQIEANLDWCEEETRFYEKLLDTLDTSAATASFLRKAKRQAKSYPNPWLRGDLTKFVTFLEEIDE